jgi:hypothetical protein
MKELISMLTLLIFVGIISTNGQRDKNPRDEKIQRDVRSNNKPSENSSRDINHQKVSDTRDSRGGNRNKENGGSTRDRVVDAAEKACVEKRTKEPLGLGRYENEKRCKEEGLFARESNRAAREFSSKYFDGLAKPTTSPSTSKKCSSNKEVSITKSSNWDD